MGLTKVQRIPLSRDAGAAESTGGRSCARASRHHSSASSIAAIFRGSYVTTIQHEVMSRIAWKSQHDENNYQCAPKRTWLHLISWKYFSIYLWGLGYGFKYTTELRLELYHRMMTHSSNMPGISAYTGTDAAGHHNAVVITILQVKWLRNSSTPIYTFEYAYYTYYIHTILNRFIDNRYDINMRRTASFLT